MLCNKFFRQYQFLLVDFHGQALKRNIERFGLVEDYKATSGIGDWLCLFYGLPFLHPYEVSDLFAFDIYKLHRSMMNVVDSLIISVLRTLTKTLFILVYGRAFHHQLAQQQMVLNHSVVVFQTRLIYHIQHFMCSGMSP
jgi:hypothetical protein